MIWRFIPYKRLNAFENMATDEALFRENQRRDAKPILRLYSWSPPSISLGYFQETPKEVDIEECRRSCIDIVRRPTGGKAVLHEHDLTYAVIAKDNNPLFPSDILGTYRVISGCIADALSELGIKTEMSVDGRTSGQDSLKAACFSSPSQYELLVNKRKICGSAQVRSRGVFLQHGSILLDFDPIKNCALLLPQHGNRKRQIENLRKSVTSIYEHIGSEFSVDKICHVLQRSFGKKLGIELVEGRLTKKEEILMIQLMKDKYTSDKWNVEGKGTLNGY
ncbi:MAG TPA: biotin/lipoate A/B protein ligase family protein [Syntrophales bacterium]|nr:biotin/lipoate A/B protein ligase family protein [Syntrophales bacterium]